MIIGIGIGFIIAAFVIALLGFLVWHTFHGDIASLFIIFALILIAVGSFLITGDIFNVFTFVIEKISSLWV